MKKTYVKPQIMFESFSVSENIAGDCDRLVGNPSKGTCAVLGSGGIAVFTSDVSACDYTPTEINSEDEDVYDGFCYHVPTEYTNLFNS